MLNWPLALDQWFSLTSRVHGKPKCDTHGNLCLIFGNIPILTNLSTLITKINVAKLNSSVKVKVWAFYYDVILQMRSFVSFNNSKFITDKNSFKALQVYCKVYSKNSWLILRCLHYGTWHLTTPSYRKLNFYLVRCWILVILQFTVTLSN